jgi:hypothetical protein
MKAFDIMADGTVLSHVNCAEYSHMSSSDHTSINDSEN